MKRPLMRDRVNEAITGKTFPGCVIGVVRANGAREIWPSGKLRYEGGEPVTEDTVYDVASITKSIPTSLLALMLIAEGKLRLGDKVTKYLPELRNDHGATIEDLLRYRVKGVQMSTLKQKTFEEIRTHVFEKGFDGPPGEGAYTNLPAFLLGIILERIGGEPLAAVSERYFFEPLKMEHTTFFPNASDCAPTEITDGVEVRGTPHDESARVFAKAGKAVGHAGLFSTAHDFLNFLEAMLQGKLPDIVEGAERGLGWQIRAPQFMGKHAGEKTFGKTGFTGTSVVCDIERGVAFVILSNRTYPKRPPDDSAIFKFRADIADIILSA